MRHGFWVPSKQIRRAIEREVYRAVSQIVRSENVSDIFAILRVPDSPGLDDGDRDGAPAGLALEIFVPGDRLSKDRPDITRQFLLADEVEFEIESRTGGDGAGMEANEAAYFEALATGLERLAARVRELLAEVSVRDQENP